VRVGSGVKVFRGVAVNVAVGVDVGMAAMVCTDAASAVCAINRLMLFASRGAIGVGVASEGTHETLNIKMMDQINNLVLGAAISPL